MATCSTSERVHAFPGKATPKYTFNQLQITDPRRDAGVPDLAIEGLTLTILQTYRRLFPRANSSLFGVTSKMWALCGKCTNERGSSFPSKLATAQHTQSG